MWVYNGYKLVVSALTIFCVIYQNGCSVKAIVIQGNIFSQWQETVHKSRAERLKDILSYSHGHHLTRYKEQGQLESVDSKPSVEQESFSNDGQLQEKLDNIPLNYAKAVDMPSLLKDMVIKSENNSARNCTNIAGRSKNHVRSLSNEGKQLHSNHGIFMTELCFSFQDLFNSDDKFTSAVIHAPLPDIQHLNNLKNHHFGSKFEYRIHWLSSNNWRMLIKNLKAEANKFRKTKILTFSERDEFLLKLRNFIGYPVANYSVSYNHGSVSEQTSGSLDITSLVTRWRKQILHHDQLDFTDYRALLIIIERKESKFLPISPDSLICGYSQVKCFKPDEVRLALISFNQSWCENAIKKTSLLLNDQHNSYLSKHDTKQTKDGKRDVTTFSENNLSNVNSHNKTLETEALAIHNSAKIESTHIRRPRSLRSTICQRHPMRIDFKDLGWSDWVIAPRAIQTYRCDGDCSYPLPGRLNGTNHALVMSMMNSVDPTSAPTPCCVPTRFSAVSILYLDISDNVVLRKYEDVVVTKCGCR